MTYPMLEGLRVLELGEWVSAPYCGKLLADMGAEVIKIERSPAGDPIRGYGPYPNDEPHYERSGMFLYLNSNKRGITLNLETPTGKELLAGLLAGSDVFVQNLHPLEMDRLEMDYSGSRRDHGSLVVASITPFGLTGPYRNYKAYDINLAAGGGICEGLGEPDREPLTFGTPQVGYFAGAAAASSIVIALLGRNLAHDPSTDGAQDSRSPDSRSPDSRSRIVAPRIIKTTDSTSTSPKSRPWPDSTLAPKRLWPSTNGAPPSVLATTRWTSPIPTASCVARTVTSLWAHPKADSGGHCWS